MKKLVLFSLLCFLSGLNVRGQIAFSREYGGAYDEDGRWMEQLPDSGFILTGATTTYSNAQSSDVWLVRTDAYGNPLWSKSYGGPSFEFANMVKPIAGGFIICGLTTKNGNDDAYLIKTNNTGDTVWEKVIGDAGTQWFEAIIPTTDSGYTAVGVNTTGTHGNYDIYLVKFNAAGVIQWERNIGGGSYEIGNSIQQTTDGGYILAGQSYSYGAYDGDFYLVKTDANGLVQWQQNFARPYTQEVHYVQKTPDGGYILVGDADTLVNGFGDADVWLVKTDSAGNFLWDQVFGGSKKDGGKTVENTTDGGFILGGITRSFGLTNPNFYLIKTDGLGNLVWQDTTYGSPYHDHAYRCIQTSDGGYAEFGFFRNSYDFENFALVKLGPNGSVNKDVGLDNIVAPLSNLCRSNAISIGVQLTNYGQTNEQNISVYLSIDNGSSITSFVDTFSGSLTPSVSTTLTFSQTYDFNLDGTYTLKAYIQHRNADISYTNDTIVKTINVIPPTADPSTTSGISCSAGLVALSATPAFPSDSMFWYDAPLNGNLVSTGNSYTTPSLASSTTYHVQAVKGKGLTVGPLNNFIGTGGTSNTGHINFDSRTPFKLVSVIVYPTTPGIRTIELRDSLGTVLQSKTITLPTAPGGIRVYLNFDIPVQNDLQLGLSASSLNLYKNNDGAVYPYKISQTVEIYGANSTNPGVYYYFYNWYIFIPSQNCSSNLVPVNAIIGSNTATAFNQSRCGSGSISLTANSVSTVQWYNAPTGGTLLNTGNTFTIPNLINTTTYYMQVDTCSNRLAVKAIINPTTALPIVSNVTHCGPGSLTLSATSGSQIYWYNAPSNGTIMGSGNTFTTPFLNATTSYYAVAGSICPSSPVAVQAIINSAAPPVVTGASACGPASVTLTATSLDSIKWFNVPTGGLPVSSGSNFITPVLSSPATYYAEAITVCASQRIPVLANIVVADPPVGTNASRCGAGSVVLSAQSLNPVTWWTAPVGGTSISNGQIFTTSSLSSTTTYYAESSVGGCASMRTSVVALINITAPPVTTSGVSCTAGPVTLTATSNDSLFWYSVSSGGLLLGTGSTFTTPSINSTTTYYVQAGSTCPSIRIPVDAFITSTVADPLTNNNAFCGTGSVSLSASSTFQINWYDSPGGNLIGTGNTFNTPIISSTTTYYAVAGSPGCTSNPVVAVATINPLPSDPIAINSSNCGPGQQTLSASSGNSLSWYDQLTGGNLLATGNSYTAAFSTTTIVYAEAFDGTCKSKRTPVTATVYTLPTVNIGPPSVIIISGTSITLNAGSGFASYTWSTTANTQTINVNATGIYYVTVQDNNGCTGSDTISVTVLTSISESLLDNAIEVFPNPTHGTLNIKTNNPSLHFSIQLTDVEGRVVLDENQKDKNSMSRSYDISALSKGIYFLRVISSSGNITRIITTQ